MSATVACARCGATDSFYRKMEVSGTGWADASIVGHDDGSIAATSEDRVQDIEWETFGSYGLEWGCAHCGYERVEIENLVQHVEAVDPIKRAQKWPIPGQMALC